MAKPIGHGGIDYPDFGVFSTEHKRPLFIDNAELAVRLGCPQTLERVGQVVLIDQFKYGLGTWVSIPDKTGDLAQLSAKYIRHTPYAVHLHTHGVKDCHARLYRQIEYVYETTAGLEVSFLAKASFKELQIAVSLQYGILGYWALIIIDNVNKLLKYRNVGGGDTTIATHNLTISSLSGWHVLKIVMDFANLEYVRLVLDRNDYSLAQIPMWQASVSDRDYLQIIFDLVGATGSESDIWIDDIILTIGEPI